MRCEPSVGILRGSPPRADRQGQHGVDTRSAVCGHRAVIGAGDPDGDAGVVPGGPPDAGLRGAGHLRERWTCPAAGCSWVTTSRPEPGYIAPARKMAVLRGVVDRLRLWPAELGRCRLDHRRATFLISRCCSRPISTCSGGSLLKYPNAGRPRVPIGRIRRPRPRSPSA
jgi:hypothetical protein